MLNARTADDVRSGCFTTHEIWVKSRTDVHVGGGGWRKSRQRVDPSSIHGLPMGYNESVHLPSSRARFQLLGSCLNIAIDRSEIFLSHILQANLFWE